MPTSAQILHGLETIANQWQGLAVLWHLYFAVLAIGLIAGMRPAKRLAGILLALPLFSVSVLAWVTANLVNGTLFALAGIALVIIALRLPDEHIQIAPVWLVCAGALLFIFGWLYPHFLETATFVPYLYAAPTGLIPCPTLAIVIGLGLMVEGLDSRAWSLVLGVSGLFYGLFGALRLGVTIDLVLVLGALLIILIALAPKLALHTHALAH